jgi:membrane fusion protein (multidrug efflux system)
MHFIGRIVPKRLPYPAFPVSGGFMVPSLTRLPRFSRILRLSGLGGAALALLLASGCGKDQKAPPPPPPAVEVTGVIQKDVPVYTDWVGTTDGLVNATIQAQVTGYLVKQNYREGELVQKGQVLFEIDPRPFQAAVDAAKGSLAQAEARWTTAKASLERIKPLAAKNAVSQKDLDDATGAELSTRASVESAKAQLETAQLNLGFTRITSPVDGIAGIAKAQIGNLVGPGQIQELTAVSTVDPIKAYIAISEQEYMNFRRKRGEQDEKSAEAIPLELILADGTVYPHKGRFYLADRQVDVKTGTMRIGALFPNPGNLLRPGQYALVRATMQTKKGALLVPQRAVTEVQGKFLVAVVGGDNTVDLRPVKPAERVGSLWVLDNGVKPGETVVVEGVQKVKTGVRVAPTRAAAEGEAKPASPPAPARGEKR